jgi:hypothetical protein
MESNRLSGKKIAILVADGFEQVELTEPQKALNEAGAETLLVSPVKKSVQGMHHDKHGDSFKVDVAIEDASADEYDGLVLPGGVMNPDTDLSDQYRDKLSPLRKLAKKQIVATKGVPLNCVIYFCNCCSSSSIRRCNSCTCCSSCPMRAAAASFKRFTPGGGAPAGRLLRTSPVIGPPPSTSRRLTGVRPM